MPENMPSTDDKGTDHIYGSGNRSVIQNAAGDRRGRPGEPLRANPSFTPDADNESTDKYYANMPGSGGAVAPSPNETKPVMHPESTTPLTLSNEADLGGVLDLAIDRVRSGQRQVLIQVTDADLERRLAARLDMAQARESIDAGQRQAIRVGRPVNLLDAVVEPPTEKGLTEKEVEKMLPDRKPTTVAATEEDLALDIDVDAFVNGEVPEEALDAPILDGLAGTPAKPPLLPPLKTLTEMGAEEDQKFIDAVDATLAGANEEDDTDDDDYFEEENLDEPPEG